MSIAKILSYVPKDNPAYFNMGLEKYNQNMFDEVFHTYSMALLNTNGVEKYKNGVDPNDVEVLLLPEAEREAKLKQIKEQLIAYEGMLTGVVIDPNDKDWYSKIKLLRPDNKEFWESEAMTLKLSKDPAYLDTTKIKDQLKIIAIKAGGYPEIGKSLADAKKSNRSLRFYLDLEEETISASVEIKKIKNKAGALLEKLYNTNVNKLMYVCKMIDPRGTQYKKSTPNDTLYEVADKYISGESIEKDKRKSAGLFIKYADMDMKDLKIEALVKDATTYRFINQRPDKIIYCMLDGIPMGKTTEQVIEFLKDPLHADTYNALLTKVEEYWKK